MTLRAMSDAEKRQAELDGYEAKYGKYVADRGPFDMLRFTVGPQSFPIYWEDDPDQSQEQNDAERRWFKRMVCCALHHLVEAERKSP